MSRGKISAIFRDYAIFYMRSRQFNSYLVFRSRSMCKQFQLNIHAGNILGIISYMRRFDEPNMKSSERI